MVAKKPATMDLDKKDKKKTMVAKPATTTDKKDSMVAKRPATMDKKDKKETMVAKPATTTDKKDSMVANPTTHNNDNNKLLNKPEHASYTWDSARYIYTKSWPSTFAFNGFFWKCTSVTKCGKRYHEIWRGTPI